MAWYQSRSNEQIKKIKLQRQLNIIVKNSKILLVFFINELTDVQLMISSISKHTGNPEKQIASQWFYAKKKKKNRKN